MRLIILLCLSGLTFANGATNEIIPVITAGPRTFTNAEVYKITTSEVWLKVGAGIARVSLVEFSPDLQRKFFYDPAKAAAEKQAAVAKQAATDEANRVKAESASKAKIEKWREENWRVVDGKTIDIKDLVYVYGQVIGVLKDGLLVTPPDFREWERNEARYNQALLNSTPSELLKRLAVARMGPITNAGQYYSLDPNARRLYDEKLSRYPYPSEVKETFFIRVDPGSYSDGKIVSGYALKGRTYQYTAVNGALRTVDSYSIAMPYNTSLADSNDSIKTNPVPASAASETKTKNRLRKRP